MKDGATDASLEASWEIDDEVKFRYYASDGDRLARTGFTPEADESVLVNDGSGATYFIVDPADSSKDVRQGSSAPVQRLFRASQDSVANTFDLASYGYPENVIVLFNNDTDSAQTITFSTGNAYTGEITNEDGKTGAITGESYNCSPRSVVFGELHGTVWTFREMLQNKVHTVTDAANANARGPWQFDDQIYDLSTGYLWGRITATVAAFPANGVPNGDWRIISGDDGTVYKATSESPEVFKRNIYFLDDTVGALPAAAANQWLTLIVVQSNRADYDAAELPPYLAQRYVSAEDPLNAGTYQWIFQGEDQEGGDTKFTAYFTERMEAFWFTFRDRRESFFNTQKQRYSLTAEELTTGNAEWVLQTGGATGIAGLAIPAGYTRLLGRYNIGNGWGYDIALDWRQVNGEFEICFQNTTTRTADAGTSGYLNLHGHINEIAVKYTATDPAKPTWQANTAYTSDSVVLGKAPTGVAETEGTFYLGTANSDRPNTITTLDATEWANWTWEAFTPSKQNIEVATYAERPDPTTLQVGSLVTVTNDPDPNNNGTYPAVGANPDSAATDYANEPTLSLNLKYVLAATDPGLPGVTWLDSATTTSFPAATLNEMLRNDSTAAVTLDGVVIEPTQIKRAIATTAAAQPNNWETWFNPPESSVDAGDLIANDTATLSIDEASTVGNISFVVGDNRAAFNYRQSAVQTLTPAQLIAGGSGWTQVNGGAVDGDGFITIHNDFDLEPAAGRWYGIDLKHKVESGILILKAASTFGSTQGGAEFGTNVNTQLSNVYVQRGTAVNRDKGSFIDPGVLRLTFASAELNDQDFATVNGVFWFYDAAATVDSATSVAPSDDPTTGRWVQQAAGQAEILAADFVATNISTVTETTTSSVGTLKVGTYRFEANGQIWRNATSAQMGATFSIRDVATQTVLASGTTRFLNAHFTNGWMSTSTVYLDCQVTTEQEYEIVINGINTNGVSLNTIKGARYVQNDTSNDNPKTRSYTITIGAAWATRSLPTGEFTNPIIVGNSEVGSVRLRNVTATTFETRIIDSEGTVKSGTVFLHVQESSGNL